MSNMKKKKMEDRISLLPDSLLHHILSSLNIKHVVQTCVLSKRWKTLWTRIPTLNFFDHGFYLSEDDKKEKSFKHFVFRVLSEHRGEHIEKLSYSGLSDEVFLVESLICYARFHKVRELYIGTDYMRFKKWKHCLLACSSLVVLKMSCAFVDDWEALMLPSLKILEIHCQWECDWYFGRQKQGIKMFSGCPNLKSLALVDYNFEIASICAPKLENLELYVCDYWVILPEVELLTPNLKSVKFSNILPTIKSANSEFSCIHEVNIEVEVRDFSFVMHGSDSERQKWTENFYQLLRVFHNARSFILPLKEIQVDSSLPYLSEISFHNLKHLKLETMAINEVTVIDLPINILAYLLKCPNLETLSLLPERYRNLPRLEF